MSYSFVMGFNDDILELNKHDFNIEREGEYYLVTFPNEKADVFEEYITQNLEPGFWNEYIGEQIVFIFKFKDGKTKRFILEESNHDEILSLCCEFAETKFISVKEMLEGNDFYQRMGVIEKWN